MPLYLPLKLSKNITFLLSLLSFFFLFFRYMYQPKSRTNNVKTLFFYILSIIFFLVFIILQMTKLVLEGLWISDQYRITK